MTPAEATKALEKLLNGDIFHHDFKENAMALVKAGADITVKGTEKYQVTLLHALMRNDLKSNTKEIIELIKINQAILKIPNGISATTPLQELDNLFRTPDAQLAATILAEAAPTELFLILLLRNKKGIYNQEIAKLVKSNPEVLTNKNNNGVTATQVLIDEFNFGYRSLDTFKQCMITLARMGVDFTQVVSSIGGGESALHFLVRNNEQGTCDAEITELLQLAPALITKKNNFGETALEALLGVSWADKKETFAAFKRTAMILVNAGADITVQKMGVLTITLLHIFVLNDIDNNQAEIDQLIAINKEILNISDWDSHTPVHSLLLNNAKADIAIIEKLLSDKNLRKKNWRGETLLHAACQSGNQAAALLLLKKGLKITQLTHIGETSLHFAADSKNECLVGLLAENSSQQEINIQTETGETALHRAVCKGTPKTVQVLLNYGADPTLTDNKGRQPYQLAIQMKRIDLLPILLVPKIQELLASISQMHDYGASLHKKGAAKGQIMTKLADLLITKTNNFFQQKPEEQAKGFQNFQSEFSTLLNSKNKELGAYRITWGTIVKNIAIALTGIGLLLIAAQLVYSKATEGRSLFFFQKSKTSSEEKIAGVQQCIGTVEQSVALQAT